MGYAKDIAAWACQGEVNPREAALLAWGETWLEQGIGLFDARAEPAVQKPRLDEAPHFLEPR